MTTTEPLPHADAVCARFERLYAPAILDVMEERGLLNQALAPGLAPNQPGHLVAGRAFPYRFEPSTLRDGDVVIGEILGAYEAAPAGAMLVAAAGVAPPWAAHFGELSATTCSVRGLRGAVIDGGLRDGPLVSASGFPVWFRYRTPVDVVGRYRVAGVGEPVCIDGVDVCPGDVVVADIDGVVIVPGALALEVLEAAEACCSEEATIRRRLEARESATELFAEMGRF